MKRIKTYIAFSKLEYRRILQLRYIAPAMLFVLLCMYLVQDGVNQYIANLEQKEDFKTIELEKANKYPNYTAYGVIGFRIFFASSPLEIFFNKSGVSSQITASLNSSEVLSINSSTNGKDMFKTGAGDFSDFGSIMMLVGYLMVLYYAARTFRHKEYIKMLSNVMGFSRLHLAALFCRFQAVGFFFLLVMAGAVGLVLLNGIVLTGSDFLNLGYYFLDWLLTAFFLFILGGIIGKISSREVSGMALAAVWFIAVLVLPQGVHKAAEKKASTLISNFKIELQKWNHIIHFEDRAIKEQGQFDPANSNTKTERELIESFMNNEYKKIRALENWLAAQMDRHAAFYRGISLAFPTTFSRTMTHEMSGKGYNGVTGFYRYCAGVKDRFCTFYKNKRYYSGDKHVEPFIKGEENIYYGQGAPPANFIWSLAIKIAYILILLLVSYIVNRVHLFNYALNKKARNSPRVLALLRGELRILHSPGSGIGDYLYRVFSGKGKKKTKNEVHVHAHVHLDGRDTAEAPAKTNFLYICDPARVPGDLPAAELFTLLSTIIETPREQCKALLKRLDLDNKKVRFGELPLLAQFEILFSLSASRREIYIFRDTAFGMPGEAYVRLRERMEELSAAGALVIYITSELVIVQRQALIHDDYREIKLSVWQSMVDSVGGYPGMEKSIVPAEEIEEIQIESDIPDNFME